MKNNLKCVIAFALGAAVGVAASWKVLETKYRKIADEEIASVKEVFSVKPVEEDTEEQDEEDTEEESEEPEIVEPPKPKMTEYAAILANNGYITPKHQYATYGQIREKEGDSYYEAPYTIPPGELGECDYEVITLTYFEGDGVLADEMDEPVDDIPTTVGADFSEHFGEYEDDTVCIRNDARKVDFEIMLDVRTYSEMMYLRKYEE